MTIRPNGAPLVLTDEELCQFEGDLTLLSTNQRRERRWLRRRLKAKEAEERRAARVREGGDKKLFLYCQAKTLKGQPCKGYALANSPYCVNHVPKEVKRAMGRHQPWSKKKNSKQSVPVVMKQVVERAVEELLRPYFEAAGLRLAGWDDESGEPVVERINDGLLLHGESKEGDIVLSDYPNLAGQVQIIEKLLDRVYGKPRVTTVIEGGDKPIRTEPVRSEDRAAKVAELLNRSHALPPQHEGRQRRDVPEGSRGGVPG